MRDLPPADPVGQALGRPEYRLGPGDLVKLQVFQLPDLDREVRVDNAGRITLPLIGAVDAAGSSISQIESQVASRYRDRYLQNPQVTLSLLQSPNQQVTVGGAVEQTGIYPMGAPYLTLQQAVALAKGVSNVADRRNVIVFRTVNGERVFARFDLVQIQQGKLKDPDIYGGDIVIVDRSGAQLLLRTLIELTPFVGVWRAYR
ncbi:polysaccharide biosynthesis/export family protein [Pseudoxanthomonas sacheonensis]|uniref:Polysaccharide export outer membrane protein n=1 Tax=Pseudoxanthomonas sacheonensis TaxID=443615 RepID=A0ABU1RWB4_9GAMM|nr:polysaccharide biosynthesis/export family protein [Pseudoxanthomonas sacheonensis]MDR6843073.1 polysaccharide export outer membrane protein [Pseudoxanthomonas sacheonensis]